MPCLDCRRDLSAPDATHRYCPYCGAIRVIADPAGSDVEQPGLVVGLDTIGPRTGDRYATFAPAELPQRVDPILGPHRAPGGGLWSDLYSASGTPLPETALFPMLTKVDVASSVTKKSLSLKVTRIAARHRRIFALLDGGQLWSLLDSTLDYAPGWVFPKVEGQGPKRLHISETLASVLVSGPSDQRLQAFDIGLGQPRIDMRLPYARASCSIDGGVLTVVGRTAQDAFVAEKYRLTDFERTTIAEPTAKRELRGGTAVPASGETQIAAVGRDHVIALADGRLFRWNLDSDGDPAILWPNPRAATLVPMARPLALGPCSLGFLTVTSASEHELLVVEDEGGEAGRRGPYSLPILHNSRARLATAGGGQIFYAAHPGGQSLSIYRASLESPGDTVELCTLAGSDGFEATDLFASPWNGRLCLLLRGKWTDNNRLDQVFWLIDAQTGETRTVFGNRHQDEAYEVIWSAGRAWLVNLEGGVIECERD